MNVKHTVLNVCTIFDLVSASVTQVIRNFASNILPLYRERVKLFLDFLLIFFSLLRAIFPECI